MAVLGLIVVNALLFLLILGLSEADMSWLLEHFSLIPLRYSDPDAAAAAGLDPHDYWPLLTSTFLHGGWLHILLNMWTLWIFGPAMEARCGRPGFLVLYLAGGVAASTMHLLANWTSPEPTLGASGAISAVVAAYAVTYPSAKVILLVPILFLPLLIPLPALVFAGFWFVLQVLQGTEALFNQPTGSSVAWWAHIGGFVFGIIFGTVANAMGLGREVEVRRWSGRVPRIPRR